jgi:hypothetical protein
MTGEIVSESQARGEPASEDGRIETYAWEPRPGCRQARAWTRIGDVGFGVTISLHTASRWWPAFATLEIGFANRRDRWGITSKWTVWLPDTTAERGVLPEAA